ncbi:MAG: hypothetical protein ICV87_00095 [Gemmatimonadetes bacterium]|nr:hypothetical protein [Gemmatimonadota bacterium]
MSALPGDPTPNAFVFPPFVPPVSRPVQPAAQAPARAETPVEDFGMEVPLPAHDVGDPDDLPRHGFDADEAGTQPWEDAAPSAVEDLPWLEMPAGGPRVHAAEDPTPWGAPAAQPPSPAADFSYDYTPAAEPAADFAYDFAPAAEPVAEAASDDEAMPWADTSFAADAPAETPAFETPSFLSEEPAEAPSYEAAAEPAWEPAFTEPDASTPAEAAFSAEAAFTGDTAPADEFPVDDEAARAYEDAGFTEVPTSASFDGAAQIIAAAERDGEIMAAAPPAAPEYGEVADRLEAIARSLRDDPAAFLAGGTGDALGLLVTGFVLGYGHGRREHGV